MKNNYINVTSKLRAKGQTNQNFENNKGLQFEMREIASSHGIETMWKKSPNNTLLVHKAAVFIIDKWLAGQISKLRPSTYNKKECSKSNISFSQHKMMKKTKLLKKPISSFDKDENKERVEKWLIERKKNDAEKKLIKVKHPTLRNTYFLKEL